MAKDDYFVVAYRILKYLYECLKAGEPADVEMFDAGALKINPGYWVRVMKMLHDEGYIEGISFLPAVGGLMGAKIYDARITQKGIEFLQENNSIKKAIEALKTAKEIVPGF